MKKSRIKIISHTLISAAFRGLAVFAVFGMALYAYAISYPATSPNPVSGVVGLYQGKTPGTYTGDQGGYGNVNAFCDAAYSDTHVCTPMEMINSYNHDPSGPLAGENDTLWLNSGAPAYFSSISNDCLGWQNDGDLYGEDVYGSVWDGSTKYGSITYCSFALSYACCK